MGAAQKFDLEHRLEAYFATLRSAPVRDALKRSAGNWQIYAAVTGSAVAMVTGASASSIGSGIRHITGEPMASVRALTQHPASSKNIPLLSAVRVAMARQDSRARLFKGVAGVQTGHAIQAAPSISPGGVVPVDGTMNTIQPGEWISIYGSNLASGNASSGDFPALLGGTSVTINGKAAYLLFVSPGQINLQAPDDTARGPVSVVVTTAGGTATSTVTLSSFAPSLLLIDSGHVAGIIPRSNGLGAYGGGAYDILGPTGSSLGYPTVAAQAGDSVELFGVGFGPTIPAVPAGVAFSGAAPIDNTLSLKVNGIVVKPLFVGLSSAGLYQINLTIPFGLGEGDVPLQAVVGGMETQRGILLSLRSGPPFPVVPVAGGSTYIGNPGNPGTFFTSGGSGTMGAMPGGTLGGMAGGPPGGTAGGTGGMAGGSGGGTGGGSGGGTGGGSLRSPHRRPYEPKMQFPPK